MLILGAYRGQQITISRDGQQVGRIRIHRGVPKGVQVRLAFDFLDDYRIDRESVWRDRQRIEQRLGIGSAERKGE